MIFTKESRLVLDYVLLINKGLRTFDSVPDLFNLRSVVESCLNK